MCDVALIGIGNPDRGDDGAGWTLIDEIAGYIPPCIASKKTRGDISEILEIFSSYQVVYLIDAVECDEKEGTLLRIDALKGSIPLDNKASSTHCVSISQAIELAKIFGTMPKKLILYGICGKNYSLSSNLSPNVKKSIGMLKLQLLQEEDIHRCTNKA